MAQTAPPAGLLVTDTPTGARVEVRVMPRSSHNRIDGVRAGRLVVRVTAPPVDHAANQAMVAVVADALGLTRAAVRLTAGQASRNKVIVINGVSAADVRARLART